MFVAWQERLKAAKRARQLSVHPSVPAALKLKLRQAATNLIKLVQAQRSKRNPISPSTAADRTFLILSENSNAVNQAALEWLRETKEHAPFHHLHLLSLAAWGLENGAEGDWPERNRYCLQDQVNLLFGWKPENVLAWMFGHPDGEEDPKEQEANLLNDLNAADSPKLAASFVLNVIYSRQVSVCPALQPAASELS
jgi:hypothetical protein